MLISIQLSILISICGCLHTLTTAFHLDCLHKLFSGGNCNANSALLRAKLLHQVVGLNTYSYGETNHTLVEVISTFVVVSGAIAHFDRH